MLLASSKISPTQCAPDAPWTSAQSLDIFRQTIRQLANLGHTTSSSQPHYEHYHRILELLADVKIGVVLVDLAKDADEQTSKDALEVLADLFRTILHNVRMEHNLEISEMVQRAISACLEEYFEGHWIPTALLDELLLAIGQGPKVLVVTNAPAHRSNSNKKSRANTATGTAQVEQINPAYMVSAAVVRKTTDRLSTPIANLLNGLLNKEPHHCSESCISTETTSLAQPRLQDQELQADVWSIVYEFHKIAPQILTTVIGTVASGLEVTDKEQRSLVTQLLGKLFASKSTNLAFQFRPCFQQWLKRSTDVDVDIRKITADALIKILSHPSMEEDVMTAVVNTLTECLENEAVNDLKLHILRELCSLAYTDDAVPFSLLQALSQCINTKNKAERKDALTGLARIYYKQYTSKVLAPVNAGGDDVPLEVVLSTLNDDESEADEKYAWIPQMVLMSFSYNDKIDAEMHTRVIQVLDDVLLGSELSGSSRKMTNTARAVGLAKILDTMDEDGDSYKFMGKWMEDRAKLQSYLSQYLDARVELRNFEDFESIEFMSANAKAEDLLEAVASLTAPTTGSKTEDGERSSLMQKIHTAKDKHIFRILSTICSPTHSATAKGRAMEELPKRFKPMGEAAVTWVKSLIKRCTMGDFMNEQIIRTCILLAQEAFNAENIDACMSFLNCVKLAAKHYPEICVNHESFATLMELFSDGRRVSTSNTALKKAIDEYEMVTVLTGILAAVAPARSKVCGIWHWFGFVFLQSIILTHFLIAILARVKGEAHRRRCGNAPYQYVLSRWNS